MIGARPTKASLSPPRKRGTSVAGMCGAGTLASQRLRISRWILAFRAIGFSELEIEEFSMVYVDIDARRLPLPASGERGPRPSRKTKRAFLRAPSANVCIC